MTFISGMIKECQINRTQISPMWLHSSNLCLCKRTHSILQEWFLKHTGLFIKWEDCFDPTTKTPSKVPIWIFVYLNFLMNIGMDMFCKRFIIYCDHLFALPRHHGKMPCNVLGFALTWIQRNLSQKKKILECDEMGTTIVL